MLRNAAALLGLPERRAPVRHSVPFCRVPKPQKPSKIPLLSSSSMSLLTRALAPLRRSASVATSRSFASGIPNIEEHAVGRQRAEIEEEKEGVTLFNRDPIDTDETQGNSKDDPILVPSFADVRPVGISHNDSSYVFWFNLAKGKVHYVPSIEKYFLLYNPEELAQLVKEVEAKQQ